MTSDPLSPRREAGYQPRFQNRMACSSLTKRRSSASAGNTPVHHRSPPNSAASDTHCQRTPVKRVPRRTTPLHLSISPRHCVTGFTHTLLAPVRVTGALTSDFIPLFTPLQRATSPRAPATLLRPPIRRGCFSPAQGERSFTSRVYRACAFQVKEHRPQIESITPQHGCCAGHAGHATAAGQSCEYVCAGECHPAAWHDQGGCPANIQGMCLHCLLWFVRGLTCRVEISADEGSRRARDRPRVDACAWHTAGDTAEDGIA